MIIKCQAKTPEEMKSDIVKYLNYQASVKRSQARIANGKRVAKTENDKAEVLEFVAKEIAAIVIED